MMEVTQARYLAISVMMPLIVPQALLFLPHWRYSRRAMGLIFLAVELGLLLMNWLCWRLLGATLLAVWLAGILPAVLCIALFVHCYALRDGRLAFLMVTISLNNNIIDTLTSMLVSRDETVWCVYKVLITLAQCGLLLRFCRRPLLEMLESNQTGWGRMTVVPLSLWACLMDFYTVPVTMLHREVSTAPTLILCLTVVLIYVMLYHFQKATQQCTEARQYSELLGREVEALTRQDSQREAADARMRVLRHDIRHYISLFQGALDHGETEAAHKLLELLEREAAPPAEERVRTGSTVMDLVIAQAAERAERTGVAFQAEVALPGELRVDVTELAVAVSNALENALQAAAREPAERPRQVVIRSRLCQRQLLLVISNSFSGSVRLDRRTGLPLTGQPGHGYGTLSISMFAQKYGCLLDCRVQEGVFSFRLLI